MRKKKSVLYLTIFVMLSYALVEGLSSGALYILLKYRNLKYQPADVISKKQREMLSDLIKGRTNYLVHSPVLGWTIKPYGKTVRYQANSAGLRSSSEYRLTSADKIIRIASFGDSFTHCDDVKNDETWQALLEQLDARLEVMNFGVPGFGLDQAYLRYRQDGMRYKPQLVFVGFMSEDILRHMNTFRPIQYPGSDIPLAKPRFILENENLTLVPNPMPDLNDYGRLIAHTSKTISEIGKYDSYYPNRIKSSMLDFSPVVRLFKLTANGISSGLRKSDMVSAAYKENSEALVVTEKIIDEFHADVIKQNSLPVLLIFPNKEDLVQFQKNKTKRYQPLLTHIESRGYRYIDMLDAFAVSLDQVGVDYFFKGHYSVEANTVIARHIYQYLNSHFNGVL